MTEFMPQITQITSMPFDENTYVVRLPDRDDCLVIDPGFEPDKIFAHLEGENITPAAIVCTHGHSDHIAGNQALKQRWPECPLLIGAGDAEKLTDPMKNLSGQFGLSLTSPPADRLLSGGEQVELAGMTFQIRDTPGHSGGHIVLVLADTHPMRVFGGDVLFRMSIGRTDFPDGDAEVLEKSIREQLYDLPDDTIVYTGHGPQTTIGFEKQHNPFFPVR